MKIADALSATLVSTVDLSRYIAVTEDVTVAETVDRMAAAERSCACVVDGPKVVGIFTQRDYLLRIVGRPTTFGHPMREEMTTPVQTMRNTQSVADGLAIMTDQWVRSVPVVDDDDDLVGSLSFVTVVSTINNLLASRISGESGEPTVHHGLTLVDFTGLHMDVPAIVRESDALGKAINHMRTRGHGSIVVTDERENLVGELTEFGLQMKLGCRDVDLADMTVADVMDPNPVALASRSSIADGLAELFAHESSHVPLTGESGRPIGVASIRDIATYVETILETLD